MSDYLFYEGPPPPPPEHADDLFAGWLANFLVQTRGPRYSGEEPSYEVGGVDDVDARGDEIVITAQRDNWIQLYHNDQAEQLWDQLLGLLDQSGWDTIEQNGSATVVPDKDQITVEVTIERPLTEAEQRAVEALKTAVANTTRAVNSIPDTAKITLANGSVVTGAELKALWSLTDFTINDIGTIYPSGSANSAANYNNGNPSVEVNINVLSDYNRYGATGLEYFSMHELGHMTQASRIDNNLRWADGVVTEAERLAHERMANDIARAIANAGGLATLGNATDGYSTQNPLIFE